MATPAQVFGIAQSPVALPPTLDNAILKNLVNAHFGKTFSIKATSKLPLANPYNFHSLVTHTKPMSSPVLLVHVTLAHDIPYNLEAYDEDDRGNDPPGYVIVSHSKVQSTDNTSTPPRVQDYGGLVVVLNDPFPLGDAGRISYAYDFDSDFFPPAIVSSIPNLKPYPPEQFEVSKKAIIYHQVSKATYVHYMSDSDIPNDTKTLSTLFMLFPHVQSSINQVAQHEPYVVKGPQRTLSPDDLDRYKCLTAMAVFTPAYTKNRKLAEQLSKRLNFACSGATYNPPTREDMATEITSIGWQTYDVPPALIDILGEMLCIDKNGAYKVDIKFDELIEIAQLRKDYNMTEWAGVLLAQSRIIYMHYRKTTLMFAARAYDAGQALFSKMAQSWVEEVQAMKAIREGLEAYPYWNCVGSIPIQRTVNQMRRLSYIGLKWHERNLKTVEEKETFSQYATQSVRNMIQSDVDKQMCEKLAFALPDYSLMADLSLIGSMSAIEAVHLMNNYSDSQRNIVFNALASRDSKAPWYLDESRRRGAQERARMNKAIMEYIEGEFQKTINKEESELLHVTDATRVQAIHTKVQTLRAAFNEERAKLADIEVARLSH